jgi:23S rRNA (uracil1939-C5)-methyltransferase
VWASLRAAWGEWAARLPSGPELRLTLRVTARGAASLLIDGGYAGGQPDVLLQLVPQLRSIWHRPRPEDAAVLRAGDEFLDEQWGDARIRVSGALFTQVNRGAALLLDEHVFALADVQAGQRVIDAYCGVGLHARRFARSGAITTGIELDTHAAAEARRAGVDVHEGSVEDVLPALLPADLVILNPPRGGVDVRVVRALLDAPPARIIYISCDPATLARDIARLHGAFALGSVRAFDLFPQTTHVETVADLTCSIT